MLVFSRTASHITTWLLMVPLSGAISGAIFTGVCTLFFPQGANLNNYLGFALISLIAAVLCLAVAVVLRQLPTALDRSELWEPW
jgi:hypothetical protein